MPYLVEFTSRAEGDLIALFEHIDASDSIAAARWFNGLQRAIDALDELPRRCPPAPESKKSGRALRHLLYGKKPHVYRVIFEIVEASHVAKVLIIRHSAMDEATWNELG